MKKIFWILLPMALAGLLLVGCHAGGITTEVTAKQHYFEATILEVHAGYLLIEPDEQSDEWKSADQIVLNTSDVGEEQTIAYLNEAEVGDRVNIGYLNDIAESYPAIINEVFSISLLERASELS